MRRGIAGLAIAVSLGFVGLASAEESGNWFTRIFTPAATKADEAKKLDVKIDPTKIPAAANNNRAIRAKADLDRRQEVCLKLIEYANALGDDDLRRKAEQLDQRALDLYYASKNQERAPERVAVEPATKKGGR